MRDKSSHRKEKSAGRPSPKQPEWVKQAVLKQAKGLFDQKMSPEGKKLHDAIFQARGTDKFEEAVGCFIEKFGFPEDWRTLLLLLDHSDEEVFGLAVGRMVKVYKQQNISDRRSLKSKLSIVSNMSGNGKIRLSAKKALSNL